MGCLKLTYYEQETERNEFRKYSYAKELTLKNSSQKAYRSYLYSFQGQEHDDEIKGKGNWYTFGDYGYDPRIVQRPSPDPHWRKYPNQSPYSVFNGNPIMYIDPNGRDGIVAIRGNTITVTSKIFIWGDGATKDVAKQMQKDIMDAWNFDKNGENWTYKDPESGKVYDVVFDVTVKLAKGIEKNMTEPDSDNKHDTHNYIKVNKSEVGTENRSFVEDSHKGEWRGTGRDGKSLAEDDPAPHEFGHLLGLPDLYLEGGGYKHPGHEGNIMAEPAMKGKVWQGNIDRVIAPAVKRLNSLKETDFKKQVRKGERSFYYKVGNRKD